MQLAYYFEVVSNACATIEVNDDELEKPWDEMTDEEKRAVAESHEAEAYDKAAYENDDVTIGDLNFVEDETGKELCSVF